MRTGRTPQIINNQKSRVAIIKACDQQLKNSKNGKNKLDIAEIKRKAKELGAISLSDSKSIKKVIDGNTDFFYPELVKTSGRFYRNALEFHPVAEYKCAIPFAVSTSHETLNTTISVPNPPPPQAVICLKAEAEGGVMIQVGYNNRDTNLGQGSPHRFCSGTVLPVCGKFGEDINLKIDGFGKIHNIKVTMYSGDYVRSTQG